MLAQTVNDSWPSLLLQTGCFGLVVYIVTWMYPQHVKEMRAERESRDIRHDASIASMLTEFKGMTIILQERFEARNEKLIKAIEARSDSWKEARREMKQILAAKSA